LNAVKPIDIKKLNTASRLSNEWQRKNRLWRADNRLTAALTPLCVSIPFHNLPLLLLRTLPEITPEID